MGGQDWLNKDFYSILGVAKDADAAAIKKAYRKLARTWHPDQNPGDTKAEERFKEIGEAYAVLSDKEQRQQYDALRAMAGGGARFSAGPGGAGAAGFEDLFGSIFGGSGRSRTQFGNSGANSADYGNIFESFFSSGSHGTNFGSFAGQTGGNTHFSQGMPFGAQSGSYTQPRSEPIRGENLKATTTLSLRQSLEGATVRMKVGGRHISTRIPAGVKDGQTLKLSGKGKAGRNGGTAGDLLLTVHVRPDARYTRNGNDLQITVPVTVSEALLGAEITVPDFDGAMHTVTVPAGSSSGTEIPISGAGVTTRESVGDLVVILRIQIPTELTEEQRERYEALADIFDNPHVRDNFASAEDVN
ncbi:DnaJ C-terminal domain-containing protein [Schaalia sp. lx-100]|uniref:DnaJ C-terminal domain-containing protein n=1 Tax=Schaalia sp. lx-100 TaxID=2899081 RepID=UPI001E48EBE8|nr:DnaJ domain-containing protein [Schaalia sp. lx-100]